MASSGAGLSAVYAAWRSRPEPPAEQLSGAPSSVAVVKAPVYSAELVRPMLDGLRACDVNVRGKNVLLKPNLVEFDRSTTIQTDCAVVAAAYEALRSLGAASVAIGEGPGHRRDTLDLARSAGYLDTAPDFARRFTDLNRDDVSEVRGFADEGSVFLPNTALRADLIVSLAKMKTHHWAGVTLSMKNLFGLLPGSVYGWPKNRLHHIGISRSILEMNRIFRNTFAIVDGISGMEGNGPIQGRPKHSGVLVMGRDLRAVDATCCRIMHIDPMQVEHLHAAASLGHIEPRWIEQRGEGIAAVACEYELIPQFAHLRTAAS